MKVEKFQLKNSVVVSYYLYWSSVLIKGFTLRW